METNIASQDPTAAAMASVRGMKGWIKFLGVMNIIGGGINALTIVGILWAWLPIWVGVILMQAGSRAEAYAASGDAPALAALLGRLRAYFTISGVTMIVSMVMGVIGGVVWVLLIGLGVFSSGSLLERLRSYSY
jgi:hypothetical protein